MTDTFARICLLDLLRTLAEDYPQLEASVLVGDTGAMERLQEPFESFQGFCRPRIVDPAVTLDFADSLRVVKCGDCSGFWYQM